MTTAQILCKDAAIEIGAIGIADTLEADDAQMILRRLNRMLNDWAAKNLFAFHTGWQVFNLAGATETMTIGPGGDVNTTRPVRLAQGSFARVGDIDVELTPATITQWASIHRKNLPADFPEWVYYEADAPLGILHFWPQAACEIHLAVEAQLSQFADLSTQYALEPGYENAIVLSLAEALCRPYSRPVPVTLPRDASNARRAIKLANFQVPELSMPTGFEWRNAGGFGTSAANTADDPNEYADAYCDDYASG